MMDLPFNRPHSTGDEFHYIREAIDNGHLSGNGPFSRRCCAWLEQETTARRALMTHSCTGALEMAAMLAGIERGDEVVMPSFTFVSTANSIVLRGGVPVFVDVRPDTFNLDETLVEAAIGRRTKAIMAVHYAGVACEMDALVEIARRHRVALLEDAAQAVMCSYDGRPLGSFGGAAAVSFHETKNLIAGEGGALLVNDPDWVERAEILHEKGTNRSRFFRGEIDKYTWVDIGSSFLMSEIGAAFLWAQFEHASSITRRRLDLWSQYHEALADLEVRGLLRRPIVPAHCVHNAHMYYVLLPNEPRRIDVTAALRERGAHAVFHYVPLHSSPAGRRFGRVNGELRVTDDVSERLLRLPLWHDMSTGHIGQVVSVIERVLSSSSLARSAR